MTIAVGVALLLWATHDSLNDDSHITFTYSRNIADGHGFVFNLGDRTLSTTTPLVAMVMAVPSAVGLDLRLVGILLSAGAVAALAAVLYRNLSVVVGHGAAVAGVLVLVLHPFVARTMTNEMMPYTALALWSLHSAVRGRAATAATLASLCVLTRPDGGLVVVMVAVILGRQLWLRRRQLDRRAIARAGAVPVLASIAVLGPWLVFATVYFGSPIPVTLRVKQNQRAAGEGRGYIALLRSSFGELLERPGYPLATGLVVLGAVMVAWGSLRRRAPREQHPPQDELVRHALMTIGVFAGWNALFGTSYVILGVNSYGWYVSPLVVSLSIIVAVAARGLGSVVGRVRPPLARTTLVVAGVAAVMYPLLNDANAFRDRPPNRADLYPDVGRWIAENVPPDATVGTLEVGLIGYYGHRTIIDFAGLIQPEITEHPGDAGGYDGFALEAWQRFRPDFVAMLRPGLASLVADAGFAAHCSVVASFAMDELADVMDVYDCRTASS